MTIANIIASGAYIPRLRLPREQIMAAMQWHGSASAAASGARAICNWDEDALTLAVQAARECLANAGPVAEISASVGSVSLASTTLPFADRSNSTLLAAALDLPTGIQTADFSGSLRAGTSAVAETTHLQDRAPRLVVAADARLAKPGSSQELEFGAGAAAMLITTANDVPAIGKIISSAHLAADFVDHYRLAGEPFDYALEERWIRDEALSKQVPDTIARALAAAGLTAADISHFVTPGSASVAKRTAKLAGLEKARLQDNFREGCGETGTAHPLLMLAAALENATPGQHILAVGFGQGVDALVVRIPDVKRASHGRSVGAAMGRRKTELHYTRYLSHAGLLEVDFGMRAERDNRSAHSVAWRKHRQVTAFVGGRCRSCDTLQFPRSRVCVNPECRRTDTQSDYRLAEVTGRIKSFTEDWQAYSPRPPAIYGNIEFEGGGNLLMELTDVDPGEVSVGMQVGFAFRIKDVDPLRSFKRYFWKAVQV